MITLAEVQQSLFERKIVRDFLQERRVLPYVEDLARELAQYLPFGLGRPSLTVPDVSDLERSEVWVDTYHRLWWDLQVLLQFIERFSTEIDHTAQHLQMTLEQVRRTVELLERKAKMLSYRESRNFILYDLLEDTNTIDPTQSACTLDLRAGTVSLPFGRWESVAPDRVFPMGDGYRFEWTDYQLVTGCFVRAASGGVLSVRADVQSTGWQQLFEGELSGDGRVEFGGRFLVRAVEVKYTGGRVSVQFERRAYSQNGVFTSNPFPIPSELVGLGMVGIRVVLDADVPVGTKLLPFVQIVTSGAGSSIWLDASDVVPLQPIWRERVLRNRSDWELVDSEIARTVSSVSETDQVAAVEVGSDQFRINYIEGDRPLASMLDYPAGMGLVRIHDLGVFNTLDERTVLATNPGLVKRIELDGQAWWMLTVGSTTNDLQVGGTVVLDTFVYQSESREQTLSFRWIGDPQAIEAAVLVNGESVVTYQPRLGSSSNQTHWNVGVPLHAGWNPLRVLVTVRKAMSAGILGKLLIGELGRVRAFDRLFERVSPHALRTDPRTVNAPVYALVPKGTSGYALELGMPIDARIGIYQADPPIVSVRTGNTVRVLNAFAMPEQYEQSLRPTHVRVQLQMETSNPSRSPIVRGYRIELLVGGDA